MKSSSRRKIWFMYCLSGYKSALWKSVVALFFLFAFLSCGKEKTAGAISDGNDVALLSIGDSTLFLNDVLAKIPGGLSENDSTEMVDILVRTWVERILLEDLAKENVDDIDKINKLTEQYRSQLIINSYRRSIRNSHSSDVSEQKIRQYYDNNIDEMVLYAPIIKGFFVKVLSDSKDFKQLHNLAATASQKDMDRLENFAISDDVQLSLFLDHWVDWQRVAERIPFHFENPDEFLTDNKIFETSVGKYTYIMHISDYIPSGKQMPYDYASNIISSILDTESSADFERRLISSLINKARREGKLKMGAYKRLPV